MGTRLGSRDVSTDSGRLRHRHHEVDAPAFVLTRLVRAVGVGLAGGAVYLVVLMVAAVIDGRSPTYALRAIYAIFNGNAYLPEYHTGIPRTYDLFEVVKSLAWVAGLGVLAAIPPALWTPARVVREGRIRPWLVVGIGWSMALFAFAFLLLGFPAAPTVQRTASSFEGVRALGLTAFAIAHVLYGVAIALLLRNATRTKVIVLPA